MSQVFSADGQALSAAATLTQNVETTALTFNPLRVPFQNGKIVVTGVLQLNVGPGTTSITIRIRRNANNENVVLNTGAPAIAVTAAAVASIPFAGTDLVPDGRDCVYTVTAQQAAATGAGSFLAGSGGLAEVLSG